MNNLSDMAHDWRNLAKEAVRINYFQVPKHEDDLDVQKLEEKMAEFSRKYKIPFSFVNVPEGIEIEDYLPNY